MNTEEQKHARGQIEATIRADATAALRGPTINALLMLEQIASRSSDQSSRALAEGAAGSLRAVIPAEWFEG